MVEREDRCNVESTSDHRNAIEVAEGDFILRKFDSSLLLSNSILSRANDFSFPSSETRVIRVPNLQLEGQTYMNVRFALNLGDSADECSNIPNRACAIALQSSYELWKMRDQKCSRIDQNLLSDASFALDFYRTTSKYGNPTTFVHFDLIIMYIDFCYAVGERKSLIPSILEGLMHFVELGNEEYRKKDGGDTLYSGCYSLLHTLLVKILPHIYDKKLLQESIDAVKTLVQFGETPVMRYLTELNPDTSIQKETIESSMQEIFISLCVLFTEKSRCSHFDENLSEALNDILTALKHKYHLSYCDSSSNLASVIDAAADRIGRKVSNHEDNDMLDHDADDIGMFQIVRAVIHNAWDSEDRWLNRAKIIGGGIIALAAWRQRRSMARSALRIGESLLSPVHEIAAAFSVKSPH